MIKTVVIILTISTAWMACGNNGNPTELVGVWDMSGVPQTEFSSRLMVFDAASYMWMADKVYRYRYSEEGGRPMLHIDGDYQKNLHLVKVHKDTLLISDGLTPFGVMMRMPDGDRQGEAKAAYEAIDQVKKRYAVALRAQLEDGKVFIGRRSKKAKK